MRRLLTALMLAGATLLIAAPPAQAHNVLTGSDPKDGATIAEGPSKITLEFDQPVRQGFSQVTVIGPGGARFEQGKVSVNGPKVTMGVAPLGSAGKYVVGYRVLSSDGHPISGTIDFTLSEDGPAATGAQPAASTGPDAESTEPAAPAPANPPADPPADSNAALSAQAAEAAQNGGASMAVLWVGAALVLLLIGTVVALRRAKPAASASPGTPSPAPGGESA
ncbi:copper resistance CopC family protein [Sinosporangium siamense]|uniref:CopC domain-containing protein n=1 Tax=Sinosporangium siamense TaxID=1367973 RepID=A0A919V4F3_9ACTN|nr:copper resistance CopC family protein [Sinosporangium siamense]GII91890.1 hypothetical protein Ssi02_21210 [Sinosporangium siamense]